MINVSECFSMIGQNGCIDVATSMGMQGVDPSAMGDMSIPIFEPFFMKILIGQDCGFLCNSIPEFTAIKQMNNCCGSVAITINLLEMDILSLLGALLIHTPNTGMNLFLKLSAIDIVDMTEDILDLIITSLGFPVPDAILNGAGSVLDIAEDILQFAFDKIIEALHEDMDNFGINIMEWTDLPDFYNMLKGSGEMYEMMQYRKQMGAMIM